MQPNITTYKQITISGCEIIGKGSKSTVYRYKSDKIVKIYENNDSLEVISLEQRLATKAYELGIPTPISFDLVKTGDKYGVMFELFQSKSLSELIVNDIKNIDKYIIEYVKLLKLIHNTKVEPNDIPNIKDYVPVWVKGCEGVLDQESLNKINTLIDNIPDQLTMLHCDYHTNNVLKQDDKIILIDMDCLSYGHPIFELVNMYFAFVGIVEVYPDNADKFLGMNKKTANLIWDRFLPHYFDTSNESEILELTDKIRLLTFVRILRHVVRLGKRENIDVSKEIEYSIKEIHRLLNKVDSLVF